MFSFARRMDFPSCERRMEIKHFKSATEFRNWLVKNHGKAVELWVGIYKVNSGKAGITHVEAIDEALCFGWIDGLVKGVDDASFKIRFTPRKVGSIWSLRNVK